MSINEHTGDKLISKVNTKEYDDNYEVIFGKRPKNKGMAQEFYDDMKKAGDVFFSEQDGEHPASFGLTEALKVKDEREITAQKILDDVVLTREMAAKAFAQVGYVKGIIPEDCFRHNAETNQFMELEKEQQVASLQSKRQYPSLDKAYQQVEDDYKND